MKSSPDSLVKNLISEDFKFLSEEYSGELLELVKEKGVYSYEYMNSFRRCSEDKLPDKCIFLLLSKIVVLVRKSIKELIVF